MFLVSDFPPFVLRFVCRIGVHELVIFLKYVYMDAYMYFLLSRYDSEAVYFDEGVRTAKRRHLEERLLQVYIFTLT